ncbi:MAG TPA: hypothetical protein DCY27_06065 [Desulfobacterales bacterium]|nr:hypothetical protein [Desulfobacterales bacterium]
MVRKTMALVTLVVFCTFLFGCATAPKPEGSQTDAPSPAGRAVGGAILGALGGAAIGALVGLIPGGSIASSVARGAVAGAATGLVAGAIAGFAYGKYEEKLYRDRLAAEAFHQYKSEQGEKVFVEVVEVKPENAEQGGSVYLNSTFSVLTGNNEPVPVEISQVVMVQDKVCGQPFSHKAEKLSGTYAIAIPMQIPANAPDGKYKLMTQVKTGNATDQKVCEFMVAQKAPPPAPPSSPEQPSKPEEKAAPEEKTTG